MANTADQIVHTTDYDHGQLRVDTNVVRPAAAPSRMSAEVTMP